MVVGGTFIREWPQGKVSPKRTQSLDRWPRALGSFCASVCGFCCAWPHCSGNRLTAIPGSPCSPLCPFNPGMPLGPLSPVTPFSPRVPCTPCRRNQSQKLGVFKRFLPALEIVSGVLFEPTRPESGSAFAHRLFYWVRAVAEKLSGSFHKYWFAPFWVSFPSVVMSIDWDNPSELC